MGAAINIQGKRFGNFVIIERSGSNSDKKAVWLCKCDCGALVLKAYKYLKDAKELYCGDGHPTKICTSCNKEKYKATDFHKASKKSINPRCKECLAKWYIANQDELKKKYASDMKDPSKRQKKREVVAKSRNKNKQTERVYKKEYNKRPEVKKRGSVIHSIRKISDLNYVIKRRLRWRMRDVLKNLNGTKYKSSVAMLGCDMDFFKKYIESQFAEGMCWERIDEIHLDHKKPCCLFDLTDFEEQKKCFHYSNLQPLWGTDNLIKGRKYYSNTQT